MNRKRDDGDKMQSSGSKKTLLLVILFCLSVGVILSPVIYVTVVCGDYLDFDSIIQQQRDADRECIVGNIYGETNSEYMKIANTQYYHPNILAIGASRVMQYKGMFFNTSFYNSGVTKKRIDTYSSMVTCIDNDSMPEIIIIDLDPLNFNKAMSESSVTSQKNEYSFVEIMAMTMKKLAGNAVSKDITRAFSNIIDKNNDGIGYEARANYHGFMKDGSRNYGNIQNHTQDVYAAVLNNLKDIEHNRNYFVYGNEMDNSSIEYFKNFLSLCNDNGIHVIACIPPYAPSAFDKMCEYKDNYTYLDEIYPTCNKFMEQYGYELYDYRDARKIGISDDGYFVDGLHGGEVVYLKMVIAMAQNGSKLGKYVDINHLNELYENRKSNLQI